MNFCLSFHDYQLNGGTFHQMVFTHSRFTHFARILLGHSLFVIYEVIFAALPALTGRFIGIRDSPRLLITKPVRVRALHNWQELQLETNQLTIIRFPFLCWLPSVIRPSLDSSASSLLSEIIYRQISKSFYQVYSGQFDSLSIHLGLKRQMTSLDKTAK